MGFILVKKIVFLILIISAALVSSSFASRALKDVESKEDTTVAGREMESWEQVHHDDEIVHERHLRVKTNDYGKYDPAPAFVKPPFKLIPN